MERIKEVLSSIGAQLKWLGQHRLEIVAPKKIDLSQINKPAFTKTRSTFLLVGALVHQLESFRLPLTGGCKLGERSVRPHIYALAKLGINVKKTKDSFMVARKKIKGNRVVMYESGDTPTENVIMAAVLAQGQTKITMASANYQVQDLCYFLKSRGAKIEGIGTTTLEITGVKKLSSRQIYPVMPDPIESMAFIAVAATTNSSITIKNCPFDFLELELEKLGLMGWKYKIIRKYKSKNNQFDLVDIKTFKSKLKALPDKIHSKPYPGLNIDHLPFFVPIATQAEGETLIHDWVYEGRAVYYTELQKLGAKVKLADSHRVYITGPTKLQAAEISCPPALRPAVIILIAMLAAKGQSKLHQIYSIERGYENIDQRLNNLGAKIKKQCS